MKKCTLTEHLQCVLGVKLDYFLCIHPPLWIQRTHRNVMVLNVNEADADSFYDLRHLDGVVEEAAFNIRINKHGSEVDLANQFGRDFNTCSLCMHKDFNHTKSVRT